MAHQVVTQACGHSTRIGVSGSQRDREYLIRRAEQSSCFDCYRAEQTAAGVAFEAREHLPALVGSERQISWAQSIRAKQLAAVSAWISEAMESAHETVEAGALAQSEYEQAVSEAEQLEDALKLIADAKFWIDHRYDRPQTLLLKVRSLKGAT